MKLWNRLKELIKPASKRDPMVDRVLSVSRKTRSRRDREHEIFSSMTIDRDLSAPDRHGHAD